MSFLEIMGIVFVAVLAVAAVVAGYYVGKEALRAARQTFRVERATLGRGRRAPIGTLFAAWWGEMFAGYAVVKIGGFVLPHDPCKPVRRRWAPRDFW